VNGAGPVTQLLHWIEGLEANFSREDKVGGRKSGKLGGEKGARKGCVGKNCRDEYAPFPAKKACPKTVEVRVRRRVRTRGKRDWDALPEGGRECVIRRLADVDGAREHVGRTTAGVNGLQCQGIAKQ
jgi:hypothetical protein